MQLEGYRDNHYLENILKNWIAISQNKIIIYRNVSYGGKGADNAINFEYDKYASLFKKEFIKRVIR